VRRIRAPGHPLSRVADRRGVSDSFMYCVLGRVGAGGLSPGYDVLETVVWFDGWRTLSRTLSPTRQFSGDTREPRDARSPQAPWNAWNRRSFNPRVVGSSPTGGMIKNL
jgi:hypothetical protein